MLAVIRILFFLCLFQIIYSYPDNNRCKGIRYSNLCVKLGSKYYLVDDSSQINWYEAERFCRRQNGFLATIESAEESRLISTYLQSLKDVSDDRLFWISGNDLGSEGVFYSVSTGNILPYTEWTRAQPDNAGGNENCVLLWPKTNGFGMNDENCNRKVHFICELYA